jgi:integrase
LHRVHHARQVIWYFVMVIKNAECRPSEFRKLRWKDIEMENAGRLPETK